MNVTPGKTYKVSGTLYEKVTDKDGICTRHIPMKPQVARLNKPKMAMYKICHALRI